MASVKTGHNTPNKRGQSRDVSVNQHDILKIIHKRYNSDNKDKTVSLATLESFYAEFVGELLNQLHAGQSVDLTRLALFEQVDVDEHKGRNPVTGETITVPPRRVIKVRNRVHLQRLVAEFDDAGNVIREEDEHPAVTARREQLAVQAEREAAREKERHIARERKRVERDKQAKLRQEQRELERLQKRAAAAAEKAERAKRVFDSAKNQVENA